MCTHTRPGGDEIGRELTPSPNSAGPHTAAADALFAQAPQLKDAYDKLGAVTDEFEAEAFAGADMFYISHLGVAPAAQGRGVGSALCEYIVARGRAEGVPVGLVATKESLVS